MAAIDEVRILLVDDEILLLGLLKRHLERVGYRVAAAESAEAALELLSVEHDVPTVLIADETLPGRSGTELAIDLLDRFPEMVCLLCSGFPLSLEALPVHQRGRAGILQKPYLPAMLEQAIAEVCR